MVSERSCRTIEALLKAGQVIAAMAIVAVTVSLLLQDRNDPDAPTRSIQPAPPDETAVEPPSNDLPPLEAYAVLWQRDLRQPPIPPTVVTEAPRPTPPPDLPALLGTFVEGATAWAQVAVPRGGTRIVKPGDEISPFTLQAVEPGRAQLVLGERTYWIEVVQPRPVIVEQP